MENNGANQQAICEKSALPPNFFGDFTKTFQAIWRDRLYSVGRDDKLNAWNAFVETMHIFKLIPQRKPSNQRANMLSHINLSRPPGQP